MLIAFLIQAVCLASVMTLGRSSETAFIVCLALVFFTWGEVYSLVPVSLADFFGTRNASSNYGFLYSAKGVASILGGGLAAIHFRKDRLLERGLLRLRRPGSVRRLMAIGLRKMPLPTEQFRAPRWPATRRSEENSSYVYWLPIPCIGSSDHASVSPAQAEILTSDALHFVARLAAEFEAPPPGAARPPQSPASRDRRRPFPGLSSRDRRDPREEWTVAPIPARSHGPPRRDHRTGRSQDGHQRAQLRRECLHGGFRRRQFAHLAEQCRRPDQSARRRPTARIEFTSPEGKALPARTTRSRRCWCARAAGI